MNEENEDMTDDTDETPDLSEVSSEVLAEALRRGISKLQECADTGARPRFEAGIEFGTSYGANSENLEKLSRLWNYYQGFKSTYPSVKNPLTFTEFLSKGNRLHGEGPPVGIVQLGCVLSGEMFVSEFDSTDFMKSEGFPEAGLWDEYFMAGFVQAVVDIWDRIIEIIESKPTE